MKTLRLIAIVLLCLLGLLAVLPMLLPYQRWLPDIQRTLGDTLQSPVKLGDIHFAYTPQPHFVLENLTLGEHNDLNIATARAFFSPLDWLLHGRFSTRLELDNTQTTHTFLLGLPARLQAGAGHRQIALQEIRFTQTTVMVNQRPWGPFRGVAELNDSGLFSKLVLNDEAQRAEVTITPKYGDYQLRLVARDWELPFHPGLRIDNLLLEASSSDTGLLISELRGFIFGGHITGNADITWGETWQASGKLISNSIQSEPLLSIFSPRTRTTGRASIEADFRLSAPHPGLWLKDPEAKVRFNVRDGVLHNLDLVSVLKSSAPTMQARGGITRFDSLSGSAVIRGKQVSLSGIQLQSGKLSAQGGMQIQPNRRVNGNAMVRLSGAMNVSSPVSIGGLIDAPELRSGGTFKASDPTAQIY
jgi:hypothetical protein